MSDETLCPFSKPIIGQWCQCPYAILAERCSGKMVCSRANDLLASCRQLSTLLHQRSLFVLGLKPSVEELTHAQSLKVRCGGLLGMQRVLQLNEERPNVPELISQAESRYASLDEFPYSEIVPDMRDFSHRAKSGARR